MFLRIFFFFKGKFNYSHYADPYSKRLCKQYGFYPNTFFLFKSKMQRKPIHSFFYLFTTSIFVFTSWFLIFEIERILRNTSLGAEGIYFNALYVTIITITSVGYGDISPSTVAGKIVVMFMAIWGAVILSFIVLLVSNAFALTDHQENAMVQIDKSRKAAITISRSLKYFNLKKKLHMLILKHHPKTESAFLN